MNVEQLIKKLQKVHPKAIVVKPGKSDASDNEFWEELFFVDGPTMESVIDKKEFRPQKVKIKGIRAHQYICAIY